MSWEDAFVLLIGAAALLAVLGPQTNRTNTNPDPTYKKPPPPPAPPNVRKAMRQGDVPAKVLLTDGLGAWVACKKMLPDSGKPVLVWRAPCFAIAPGGHVAISAYRLTTSGPEWDCDQHSWVVPHFLVRRVSHWMPLPEAPNAIAQGCEHSERPTGATGYATEGEK